MRPLAVALSAFAVAAVAACAPAPPPPPPYAAVPGGPMVTAPAGGPGSGAGINPGGDYNPVSGTRNTGGK